MTHYTLWQLENCFKDSKELEWGKKIFQFYKHISKLSFQKMVNKRMVLENSSYLWASRKLSNGPPQHYIFLEVFPSQTCLHVQGNWSLFEATHIYLGAILDLQP